MAQSKLDKNIEKSVRAHNKPIRVIEPIEALECKTEQPAILADLSEKLAEMYLNGNISAVRNKIKEDGALAIGVAGWILEHCEEQAFWLFFNRMTGIY